MKRLLPLLLFVAAAVLTGCEHDGDDSFDLSVHASDDRLHKGERCELFARLLDPEDNSSPFFGDHVTWSLADPSIGHLSRTTGRRTVYHPDRFPSDPECEFVPSTANTTGSSSTTTRARRSAISAAAGRDAQKVTT